MDPRLDAYDWAYAFEVAGPPDHDEWGSPFNQPDINPAPPGADVSCDTFQRDDIEHILSLAEGDNDGPDWLIAGRLRDGRWFALRAGCDYTGWDCQSGGNVSVCESQEDLLTFGMTGTERSRLGLFYDLQAPWRGYG